jgi:hypothetical protein
LLQILSGVEAAQSLLPEGGVYSLPTNASIEISIPGGLISSPVCIVPRSFRQGTDQCSRSLTASFPSARGQHIFTPTVVSFL